MDFLYDIISSLLSLFDVAGHIVNVIPLIENLLSIIAILSSFIYFLYTKPSQPNKIWITMVGFQKKDLIL